MSLTGTSHAPQTAEAVGRLDPVRIAREPSSGSRSEPAAEGADARPVATVPSVDQLRELLNADRGAAAERRVQKPIGPIKTSSYTTPLRVLWGRYLRANKKRILRGGLAAFAAVALMATGWFVVSTWLGGKSRAWSSEHNDAVAPVTLSNETFPRPLPKQEQESRREVAAIPPSAPRPFAPAQDDLPEGARGLSVRGRLVRADALLRHPSERAARQARALLEATLPEVPKDAHGRASLAEACLRLQDEACARAAIAEALALRPLRSRYRALARQVERTFAPATAAPKR